MWNSSGVPVICGSLLSSQLFVGVRDDPRFQLVHGPLLIDVDAFRGPGWEGGGESGRGGQSQACSVCSVLYRLWLVSVGLGRGVRKSMSNNLSSWQPCLLMYTFVIFSHT